MRRYNGRPEPSVLGTRNSSNYSSVGESAAKVQHDANDQCKLRSPPSRCHDSNKQRVVGIEPMQNELGSLPRVELRQAVGGRVQWAPFHQVSTLVCHEERK